MLIGLLVKFLSGGILNRVLDTFDKKVDAGTERERISAGLAAEQIRAEIAAQASAKEIIIAEQGRWFTALPRPLFALIVLIYFAKVVLWDSVLGWGSTPAIGGSVGEWMGWIVAAYFGGRTIEKVAQIVKRK